MRPTFKELCNNDPAIAIEALIYSLIRQKRIPWLTLDFDYFNYAFGGKCYACGATFAVLNLLHDGLNVPEIAPEIFNDTGFLAEHLQCSFEDLCEFEFAMDLFRRGKVGRLAHYFNTSLPEPDLTWHLNDITELTALPLIESYLQQLLSRRLA